MNIFLPYENNIEKSVQSLDNVRLIKQIQEAKVLLDGARAYQRGDVPNEYFKHPVAQAFKNDPEFLVYYGFECCKEYWFRYNKYHQYYGLFQYLCEDYYKIKEQPDYTPYYMEGPKTSPDAIRTNNFVSILFRAKLINKWLNDKRAPSWGIRGMPEFFKEYLELSVNGRINYWKYISEIKEGERK